MRPHTTTRLLARARTALWLIPLWAICTCASAAVRLPSVISDHMVLQRAEQAPVWGWADPGEAVSVSIGKQVQRTRAGQDGRWQVVLDLREQLPAPATLQVRGAANEIVVNDVLVGEVWLASGQSNMEKPLGEQRGQKPTFDAQAEIAAADYSEIRLFKVARKKAREPDADVAGQWVRTTPASIESTRFSAAAWFFGRRLHQELRAPVGLIDSTWGGTRIEPWTPAASAADRRGTDGEAALLYNGMIAGLAPFAIRGALWYQGESNIIDSQDGADYTARMEALVTGWRAQWKRDFPFYYVQVAPHLYHIVRHAKVTDPQAAPRMWEAQAAALRIPKTGMVVTTDLVDDLFDIHPRDKKSVGLRLANLALADTYGRADVAAYSPMFRAMTVEGDKAIVAFYHAQGLAARDGKPLNWFDVAGQDGRYYPASATIEQDKVVLTSPRVTQPVAVRFAWDEAAQPNLVNNAGLPAAPFRSEGKRPAGEERAQ